MCIHREGLIATKCGGVSWGGWMGVTEDKGGLLIGGHGGPVWLAGVIEEICEELDQVYCDMGGCEAFQNEVDF